MLHRHRIVADEGNAPAFVARRRSISGVRALLAACRDERRVMSAGSRPSEVTMSSHPLTPAAPRPALLLVLAAVLLALLGQPAAATPRSTPDRTAAPTAFPATSAPTEAHPFSDPL